MSEKTLRSRILGKIATITIISIIVGMFIISPDLFIVGLFIFSLAGMIGTFVILDWKQTIVQTDERVEVSFKKQ